MHRNTIRNWVKSGRINARPGPGKGLVFAPEDFEALCREFQLRPEKFQIRELSRQPADSPVILGQNPLATREEKVSDKIVGSVMVVGGGIAGSRPRWIWPTRDISSTWWKKAPASAARCPSWTKPTPANSRHVNSLAQAG